MTEIVTLLISFVLVIFARGGLRGPPLAFYRHTSMRSRKLFRIFIGAVILIALYFPFRYFDSTRTELPAGDALNTIIRNDHESITKGNILFYDKCKFCHNAYNTETIVGPGLQAIMKNPELPVSRRPATPDNVRRQLRQPFSRMPSFDYLTDKEVEDIIAFLNTL